jgi:hypothetical protein
LQKTLPSGLIRTGSKSYIIASLPAVGRERSDEAILLTF